jgi:Uma2 family endonuclease
MGNVFHLSDLDLTKKYTYSDYLLWQLKERVELVKGFILSMSPAPNTNHQKVSVNLTGCFLELFKRNKCKIFVAPFDVRLEIPTEQNQSTVVQPDLCVICDENKLDEKGCNGSPDLIVEIISPNNRKHDLHTKFNLYQEAGVKEYWIVDPVEKMILVYTLENEKFIGSMPFVTDEFVSSKLFPIIHFSVDDIFYGI